MPKIVAILLLLATTGFHAYTLQTRSSPPGCMDPTSQPERLVSSSLCHALIKALQLAELTSQVNTQCASSLTSPSSCLKRLSYIEHCVAYCEQYLYWFFGPEVSFPDSSCEAFEPCTFAGVKSVAVANDYSFDVGLIASIPIESLEAAFNLELPMRTRLPRRPLRF